MGRVLAEATIENMRNLWATEDGQLEDAAVRRVTVNDAMVDTGATTLALPGKYIKQLSRKKVAQKQATSSQGVGPVNIYEAVKLTVMDRFCTVDVVEIPVLSTGCSTSPKRN